MTNENMFADVDDDVAVLPPVNPPAVSKTAKFEITEAEQDLAAALDLSLAGDARHLVGIATAATNQALTLVIESGLLLMAAHEQLVLSERLDKTPSGVGRPKNEAFHAILDEFGLPRQRAYEAMSMAKYAAALPSDQRTEMLALPKTKAMLLAQADPEVIADLFAGEETDITALSVRELKNQIRELTAAKTQSAVERQKTEQENVLLQKRLTAATAARADVTDIVPAHVSDIRLECAALYKKAELSIDGLARLTAEVHLLDGEWALSVARSNFAALQGLIGAARGAAAELHRAYGADLDGDNSTLERLTQKELFKCATEYKDLIATHEHEAALRAHERDVAKPKGKGRPKAAPTLD
jgi:hypothetical protein